MQNSNSKLNTVLLIIVIILLAVGIWMLSVNEKVVDRIESETETSVVEDVDVKEEEIVWNDYLEQNGYFLIEGLAVERTVPIYKVAIVTKNQIENKTTCGRGMVVSSIRGNPSIPYLDCNFIITNTSHWGTQYSVVGTWPNQAMIEKYSDLFEEEDHNTYSPNSVRFVWGKILFSSEYTDGATCAYQRQDWEMDSETGVTTLLYKTPLQGACSDGD